MKQTVIISGGDGFVGSHLAKKLAQKDIAVYALILQGSLHRSRIEGIDNIYPIEWDFNEWDDVVGLLPQYTSAFFHMAWDGVSPDERNSIDVQMRNIDMTINTINLAKVLHTKKFIFPGSTMEYSYSGQIINEKTKPSPQNIYGATKIALRYFCETICNEFEIPFIYVVISGIYSEDRIDNNVVSYTIKKLLNNEVPKLTKLEQLWDYVHINDVVKALYLILEKGKSGRMYSVGHGDNWPLSRYIYMIRDIIDPSLPLGVGEVPYNNSILPMSCVDLTNIKIDTGFEPDVDFDSGIRKMIHKLQAK